MAIDVSREKKGDTLAGRCPPESGRVSLESARQGESNDIGLEVSACLSHSVANNLKVLARELKYKCLDYPSTSGRTASGQGALESAGRGESGDIGFEASAWL